MSRLAGEPLGTRPATDVQVAAIASAIAVLHEAIPAAVLGSVRPAGSGTLRNVGRRARALAAAAARVAGLAATPGLQRGSRLARPGLGGPA